MRKQKNKRKSLIKQNFVFQWNGKLYPKSFFKKMKSFDDQKEFDRDYFNLWTSGGGDGLIKTPRDPFEPDFFFNITRKDGDNAISAWRIKRRVNG